MACLIANNNNLIVQTQQWVYMGKISDFLFSNSMFSLSNKVITLWKKENAE